MEIKKILKVIVTITIVLSAIFQAQPTLANEIPGIIYDVKFELNGGSGFFPAQTVNHGSLAKMPLEEPTRANYRFIGWFTDAGEPFDFLTPIVKHTIIHARWEPRINLSGFITVHFELNGGLPAPDFDSQTVPFARRVTRPAIDPVRSGYTFTGWFTLASGGSPFNFSARLNTLASSLLTIHAQWEPIVISSNVVSFELNGGTMTPDFDAQVIYYSGRATRPVTDPVRVCYTFIGWFTSRVDGHEFNFDMPITQNIILYARWKPALNSDNNSGNDSNSNSGNDSNHNSGNDSNSNSGNDSNHNSGNDSNNNSGNNSNHNSSNNSNNNSSNSSNNQSNNTPDSSGHLNEDAPNSSGTSMEVNDEGTIIITAPHLEGKAIKIFGALLPFDVTMGGVGELGEIFLLFPGDTEPEELDVVVPTEWTYDYFHDVPGNLVLALLPPGVDLATVLNNPSNPQPRDRSLIEGLEREPSDRSLIEGLEREPSDRSLIEDLEREPSDRSLIEGLEREPSEQAEEPIEGGVSEYDPQPQAPSEDGEHHAEAETLTRLQYASLTQHASLPNSLALVGGIVLKSGCVLVESKKRSSKT